MKDYVPYSEEIASEICLKIATNPIGLRKLCGANKHWPHRSNIYRWVIEYPSFRDLYQRAREISADFWAEEAYEIACDDSADTFFDENGSIRANHATVQRSRLRVDTIKWMLSKLSPRKYGDKVTHEAGQTLLEQLQLVKEDK